MYANEGDTFNMSLCIISVVASGVVSVGKLVVKCGKLAKATKYISTGARLIENAAVFTVSAGQAAETARGMWKKYAEDKQPVGVETLGEVATLWLSIFAAGTSAKSFGMNGNKLKSIAVKEKLGSKSVSKTLVTHRGTNEHIEKVLQQGYIQAYGPRTPIDAFIDHKNPAVWISEGNPTWYNRIFSGMVGKRGEASITFRVPSELIKKPSGIKKIFGKIQRVIEQDVEIPDNVIVRKVGK